MESGFSFEAVISLSIPYWSPGSGTGTPLAFTLWASSMSIIQFPMTRDPESSFPRILVDCLVFVTNHSQYENLRPKDLLGRHGRAIVDTRNLFNAGAVEKAGLVYKGIGK